MLINLSKYVFSQSFIEAVEADFDTIIYEKENDLVSEKIKTFWDLWYDFSQAWAISWIFWQKKILVVLDELEFLYFFPFVKNFWQNTTFILTNISFTWNKNFDDIIYPSNLKFLEPFDQDSFEIHLKTSWTKIIRLGNMEYPVSSWIDLAWDIQLIWQENSFKNIIFWGYMLWQGLKICEAADAWALMINNYWFWITKNIFSLLEKSQNYFLCDQRPGSYYELYIQNMFRKYNLDLKIIFPSFELKTINSDYVFADAKFDSESISEKIT